MGGGRAAAVYVPGAPAAGCGEYEALGVRLNRSVCMYMLGGGGGGLFCSVCFKGVFLGVGIAWEIIHDSIAGETFLFLFCFILFYLISFLSVYIRGTHGL